MAPGRVVGRGRVHGGDVSGDGDGSRDRLRHRLSHRGHLLVPRPQRHHRADPCRWFGSRDRRPRGGGGGGRGRRTAHPGGVRPGSRRSVAGRQRQPGHRGWVRRPGDDRAGQRSGDDRSRRHGSAIVVATVDVDDDNDRAVGDRAVDHNDDRADRPTASTTFTPSTTTSEPSPAGPSTSTTTTEPTDTTSTTTTEPSGTDPTTSTTTSTTSTSTTTSTTTTTSTSTTTTQPSTTTTRPEQIAVCHRVEGPGDTGNGYDLIRGRRSRGEGAHLASRRPRPGAEPPMRRARSETTSDRPTSLPPPTTTTTAPVPATVNGGAGDRSDNGRTGHDDDGRNDSRTPLPWTRRQWRPSTRRSAVHAGSPIPATYTATGTDRLVSCRWGHRGGGGGGGASSHNRAVRLGRADRTGHSPVSRRVGQLADRGRARLGELTTKREPGSFSEPPCARRVHREPRCAPAAPRPRQPRRVAGALDWSSTGWFRPSSPGRPAAGRSRSAAHRRRRARRVRPAAARRADQLGRTSASRTRCDSRRTWLASTSMRNRSIDG